MMGSMGFGAAAQAVGSIMQMIAAKRAEAEMNKAFQKEQIGQEGYSNQAFSALQSLYPQMGVESAKTTMAEKKKLREGMYDKNLASSYAIQEGRTGRDKASTKMRGGLRAQLGSYGDWQLNNMIKNIRAQDELNKLSYYAGEDAQTFPYLMSDAQHSQDDLAAMGQLIGSLGGTAANFSQLYGAPPAGGAGSQRLAPSQMFDTPQGFGQQFSDLA